MVLSRFAAKPTDTQAEFHQFAFVPVLDGEREVIRNQYRNWLNVHWLPIAFRCLRIGLKVSREALLRLALRRINNDA